MVTHLPTRFYKLVHVVRAIGPRRERIIWLVDSLILSYQLGVPYYSERCPKKETFWLRLRSLNRYQTSHHLRQAENIADLRREYDMLLAEVTKNRPEKS